MLLQIIAIFTSWSSYAQDREVPLQNLSPSMEIVNPKNYWLPAVEVAGLNIGVWSYSKFFTNRNWPNINLNSVKRNFQTGFKWDPDGYIGNQFAHPYHGGMYFSAARANGLGFWESAPYALGGSLMWEYFMESVPPSYNDIVNTPVTGILLGEISFRVSNLILDESTNGFERLFRESGAFVINPMHGLNRLIKGDTWKNGKSFKQKEFYPQISFGVNDVFLSRKLSKNNTYAFFAFDFSYGNRFSVSQHKDPFDYFTFHTEASVNTNDYIFGVFASGVLWDTKINMFGNPKDVIGVYKEVDLIINTVYKLSATSVSGQFIDNFDIASITVQNSFSLSAILMGATNSQYATEFGRNYNIGPGASASVSSSLRIKNYGRVHFSYKRYWIHTLSGAESEEFVGLLKAGTTYELNSFLNIGMDFLLYERFGNYAAFPDTKTANSALRLFAQLSF